MGTTPFVLPSLQAMLDAGHDVVAVTPSHRGPRGAAGNCGERQCTEAAERLGLPVHTPRTLRHPDAQAEFAALELDLAVVGAYGLLLPRPVLTAPRLGCINLHASLLPRWRGAAPIERAILAGDGDRHQHLPHGGGPRHRPGLRDAAHRHRPVHHRHGAAPVAGLGRAVDAAHVVAGLARRHRCRLVPQPEAGVVYAHKLKREEGRLDFGEPRRCIERRLRALNPSPGCWCEAGAERLTLLAGTVVPGDGAPGAVLEAPLTIACGTGALRVTLAQRAGRRPMSPEELLRGFPIPPGTRLG